MANGTSAIRNVALIGHGGTGKTSLFEQLLVFGGVIPKFEPVDGGKSVSDFSDEEVAHKISIRTALAHVEWDGCKVNIFDTPGSADFVGEVVAALRAVEVAIVVISAEAGVQMETLKLWRRLDALGKPRIIFISQMDKEHADYPKVLAEIREKFGVTLVPTAAPLGDGGDFSGVVDLQSGKAVKLVGIKRSATDVPTASAEFVAEQQVLLLEGAAEGDDQLMEKYLEEESLSPEEVQRGLAAVISGAASVPVVAGSAISGDGVGELLDLVVTCGPSPAGPIAATTPTGEELQIEVDPAAEPAAFVFKTSIDQYSGKLSWAKVISGTINPDQDLVGARDGKKERLHKLHSLQGGKLVDVATLVAGDIGVLTKLGPVATNDSLSLHGAIVFPPLDLPQPVHAVTARAADVSQEDKLAELMARAHEEDLTFQVSFNAETRETVVATMGELQLNIRLEHIKSDAGIEVVTDLPRIAYRETINAAAAADYQHKKQTGGRGQFARVSLEIKPLARGEEFKFVNATVGGAISKGYIPGVEKGVLEALVSGVIAGYPMVDVEAAVVDGKEHAVDSSELAFTLAARGALRAAAEQAKPTLLEPIGDLTVYVDEGYLGDILSDLSGRRARILGQEPIGSGVLVVTAQVPQAEMQRYAIDLKSMTSGTASFELDFSHYNPLSGKLAEDVIKHSREAVAVGD
jgi:elongation factor G